MLRSGAFHSDGTVSSVCAWTVGPATMNTSSPRQVSRWPGRWFVLRMASSVLTRVS